MKLILSSSDFGDPRSAKFIYDNLNIPIDKCRVLYFPNEKATADKIKNGKYESRLEAFGFQKKNIYVADYFAPSLFYDLDIDAIYISGGNTFGTMKLIREAKFDKAIINYVRNGAVYIGGSAGAHIASANIAHVAKYDKDTFGLNDLSGLGLYNGILICHYSKERSYDRQSLIRSSPYPLICLTDSESIIISKDQK